MLSADSMPHEFITAKQFVMLKNKKWRTLNLHLKKAESNTLALIRCSNPTCICSAAMPVEACVKQSSSSQREINRFTFHPDWIGARTTGIGCDSLTIFQLDIPGMQRADNLVTADHALRQRPAFVRTAILQCEDRTASCAKQSDVSLAGFHHAAALKWNICQGCNLMPLIHGGFHSNCQCCKFALIDVFSGPGVFCTFQRIQQAAK